MNQSGGRLSTVCVVGLGTIGLPLAVQIARTRPVVGCDISLDLVAAINAGVTTVEEEGLGTALAQVVASGKLRATTDTSGAVAESGVVVVIVPVELTDAQETDFSAIDAATLSIGYGLKRDTLVIVETTVPVGTTRHRLAGLLESASELEAGTDFALACSPEHARAGTVLHDLATFPRFVGGIDAASTAGATAFYRSVFAPEVRSMSSCEAAEYVKLVESTFLDVNAALANEFALFAEAHGLDAQEAIEAANTAPDVHVGRPGVGVDGGAIPVHPYFLFNTWDDFRIPPLARAINDGMAAHGVDLLEEALGDLEGRTVLILGLTARADVGETAYSSARRLSRELRHRGATVLGHDPLLDSSEQQRFKLAPVSLDPPPAVDAIILHAYHRQYRTLDLGAFAGLRALLDGRAALPASQVEALRARGVPYLRVGLGTAQGPRG